MNKRIVFIGLLSFLLISVFDVKSQEDEVPAWRKMKYLSEEEMYMSVTNRGFEETSPPSGEVRFPGEYEPMQAVMIVYPLGIPLELVREMAEDCKVITVVSAYEQAYAEADFKSAGVNMDNVDFLNFRREAIDFYLSTFHKILCKYITSNKYRKRKVKNG